MICIKCRRKIDRSYAAPEFLGNYCEPCAIVAEITTHQIAQKKFILAAAKAAEAARSIAMLNQTIKGFEDGLKAGSLAGEKRKDEWISVKERLPERNQSVLVFAKNEIYALLYERNDKWWGEAGWATTEKWGITHWMPLPEPPKESEDTE